MNKSTVILIPALIKRWLEPIPLDQRYSICRGIIVSCLDSLSPTERDEIVDYFNLYIGRKK